MKIVKALALAAGVLLAASAHAGTIVTYEFNTSGPWGAAAPGTNFGTVVLQENATGGVDVRVSLISGFSFVATGVADDNFFTFNLIDNPANSSITSVVFASKPQGGTFTYDSQVTVSGFRTFDLGILCSTQCNGGSDLWGAPLTFTVTNATVNDFKKASYNLQGNGGVEAYFAADVYGSSNGKTSTGPIAVTGPGTSCTRNCNTVPEPGSLALLALVGLGFVATRRRGASR